MRSRFVKKKQPPGLMLTSLLDMFTIILIFLIVSFEAEDYEFKLDSDLSLPESTASSVFKPAINLALTPDALKIDQDQLVKLDRGKFRDQYYSDGEIPELVEILKVKFEEQQDRPGSLDEEDEGVVLVQADKGLDYRTIYLVLRSASVAGFDRYRLAIMKK